MNWVKATRLFIPVVVFLILAYDVLALVHGGMDATISTQMMRWSKMEYGPILPFLFGVLTYHLFIAE